MTRRTVRELHHLQQLVEAGPDLSDTVCQGFAIPAGAVRWDTADLPYDPYRSTLYQPDELLAVDEVIWEHFARCGGAHPDILEALAQRLHDHAIDDGLDDLLGGRDRHTLVAVMGGHELRRDDPRFAVVARTASALTSEGRMTLTGGGPGAMEAGNLGAYLSGHGPDAITEAITTLARAPHYTDPGYVAGTAQEVFQDAAQNHYASFGPPSPMVFLDRCHWEATGLYDALRRQAADRPYAELLHLVDTPEEVVAALSDSAA